MHYSPRMRADDERNEDPKQPNPVQRRKKKDSNPRELLEALGRTTLQGDTASELDRHVHV
jgi:hypothetical protein